ncbi:MAG: insulinase family protein [Melioribacteraceae bacterium]|nr:insulinase family protein [Melioribacteraceae bacterium]MCF8355665.1 insulinase family protein [Melioribacteraceae bacterium]MCF8395133.1 insulinase family protein [Melioribacteraceae bacterium]MCF8420573.1 insulinase family protein [Melioribacteraceae bacterium]
MITDRSKAPLPKEEIDFHLPRIEKFKLPNGLKILFVEKNNLPIIHFNLVLNAGSKFDPDGKNGLAQLTSMLLDEGTKTKNALDIDDEFESLGTVFNIAIDHDSIYLSMLSLMENLDNSLSLFAEILTEPAFNDSDFEREHRKLSTQILQLKDQPSYIADSIFESVIFNGTPYSFPVMGTDITTKNLVNKDVIEYYNSKFVPDDACLVVVGNISTELLTEKLKDAFKSWSGNNSPNSQLLKPGEEHAKIYIFDKPGSPQSEIRIGNLCEPRDEKFYYSKKVVNTILGGQFSSRINLNLREDKGYTYGAHSSFYYNKLHGYFTVATAVETKNTVPAVKEILKELSAIHEGIRDDEIAFAKSYLIRKYPAMFDSYSKIASNLTTLHVYDLPPQYFENFIQNIEATEINELIAAAKNNIKTDKLSIVLIGDKTSLLENLSEEIEAEIIEVDHYGNSIH